MVNDPVRNEALFEEHQNFVNFYDELAKIRNAEQQYIQKHYDEWLAEGINLASNRIISQEDFIGQVGNIQEFEWLFDPGQIKQKVEEAKELSQAVLRNSWTADRSSFGSGNDVQFTSPKPRDSKTRKQGSERKPKEKVPPKPVKLEIAQRGVLFQFLDLNSLIQKTSKLSREDQEFITTSPSMFCARRTLNLEQIKNYNEIDLK